MVVKKMNHILIRGCWRSWRHSDDKFFGTQRLIAGQTNGLKHWNLASCDLFERISLNLSKRLMRGAAKEIALAECDSQIAYQGERVSSFYAFRDQLASQGVGHLNDGL